MFIMHVAFIITFLFVCLFFGCFLVKKKFLQNLEFSVCKFDENKNKNLLKKIIWEYVLQLILCMIFQEKCVTCYVLSNEFHFLSLLFEILGNVCLAIVCFPGCNVINFEIKFLIKPFFYITKNLRQKLKYHQNENTIFIIKKHFSSYLKGCQLRNIVSDLRVCLSKKLSTNYNVLTDRTSAQ